MNAEQIRAHIADLIKEKGKNLRALSLAIGKNEAYLHQFIHKGSPMRLPEEDRRKMAGILDVDEQELTDIKLPNIASQSLKHPKAALIEMISPNISAGTIGFLSFPISINGFNVVNFVRYNEGKITIKNKLINRTFIFYINNIE